MHHFIFPSKDTYITNLIGLENKNFGIDEMLNIGVQTNTTQSVSNYQSATYSSSNYTLNFVVYYQGSLVGSFSGSTVNVIQSDTSSEPTIENGNIYGTINHDAPASANIVVNSFTGHFTGSLVGYVNSANINGVTYTLEFVSASAISSGSVDTLSGSVSGSYVDGIAIGVVIGQIDQFSGSLNGVSGTLIGDVSGSYYYYQPHFTNTSYSNIDRTLLKFDISAISESISRGDIMDPKFVLNLKVLNESEIPVDYSIYAYPISQSWSMGDGREGDGGSDRGASWNYKDINGGQFWYTLNPSTQFVDYLNSSSYQDVVFGNGGGTWYYNVPNTFVQPTSNIATPFFSYEISTPTFEQQYSSSLDVNLSSSFDSVLSSSLASVISSSNAYKYEVDSANDLLLSIAIPTYENASSSISSSLSMMDQSASAPCSSETYYQIEYSSSVAFLNNLSSSIQSIVHDSSSAAAYGDNLYLYDLYLSSSMNVLTPATFDEVYAILNQWSYDAHYSSSSQKNVNDVYNGFSSSLSAQIGTTDPNLVYVESSISPFLITSSIDLINAQFTSSATDSFSSSLLYYLDQQIKEIEDETSASVSSSLTEVFASPFCSTLYTGSSLIVKQNFSYEKSDITMDVTPIVKSWICGCVPNEGIILLTSEELNILSGSNSNLSFFSKETNTIYTPYLDVVWDDSKFDTGTLDPITGEVPYVTVLNNVKKQYKHNSLVRVNVFARDQFSLKNFVKATQQSVYLTPKYLPETTYYAIKDTETEEMVIDFDLGTKLSCDENGNYFLLDMTGLPQERYFKILLKTEINGGVDVIDNNTYFKVVR